MKNHIRTNLVREIGIVDILKIRALFDPAMLKPEGGTELRLKSKYIAERFFEGCSLLIIHVSAGLLVVTLRFPYHCVLCEYVGIVFVSPS